MADYNSQAFTPDEVKKGLHLDLLNYLLDHNKKNENQYYDIHITTDGYCTIIEWKDVNYNQDYGPEGKFGYIPYNGLVMLEYDFPDNHREMCYDEEDYKERLKEFLEENPGWVKTSYGTWTNEIENAKAMKTLFEKQDTAESYYLPPDTNMDDMCYCASDCCSSCARAKTRDGIVTESDFSKKCCHYTKPEPENDGGEISNE